MGSRRTEVKGRDVAKVFEAAGWASHSSGSHIILRRDGHHPVTLPLVLSRNDLSTVRQALGVAYSDIVRSQRGKGGSSPKVWLGRLTLAQQLRRAGFDAIFIDRCVHIRSLYNRGFTMADLDSRTPEEIVRRLFGDETEPGPPVVPADRQNGDEAALLALLAELSDRVGSLQNESIYRGLAAKREERLKVLCGLLRRTYQTLGEALTIVEAG